MKNYNYSVDLSTYKNLLKQKEQKLIKKYYNASSIPIEELNKLRNLSQGKKVKFSSVELKEACNVYLYLKNFLTLPNFIKNGYSAPICIRHQKTMTYLYWLLKINGEEHLKFTFKVHWNELPLSKVNSTKTRLPILVNITKPKYIEVRLFINNGFTM